MTDDDPLNAWRDVLDAATIPVERLSAQWPKCIEDAKANPEQFSIVSVLVQELVQGLAKAEHKFMSFALDTRDSGIAPADMERFRDDAKALIERLREQLKTMVKDVALARPTG